MPGCIHGARREVLDVAIEQQPKRASLIGIGQFNFERMRLGESGVSQQLKAGYKSTYGFRDKIDLDGYNFAKRPFDLAEGLIRRKYSDANIEAILGGNFRRVLKEIWTV